MLSLNLVIIMNQKQDLIPQLEKYLEMVDELINEAGKAKAKDNSLIEKSKASSQFLDSSIKATTLASRATLAGVLNLHRKIDILMKH